MIQLSPNRLLYLLLLCFFISAGLLVRKFSFFFPDWINLVLGDTLWAMAVFFSARLFFPKQQLSTAGANALLFCFAVELSQLYSAEWINAIRKTSLGGLVLGFVFLWSDLLAYTVGVLFGGVIETAAKRIRVLEF